MDIESLKKRGILVCIMLFVILSLANAYLVLFYPPFISTVTGSGITASVSLIVEGAVRSINISSPLNITYNFSVGDSYLIDLNVSAAFTPTNWFYTLLDLKHDETKYFEVDFSPNITFTAVRWSNRLLVYANDSSGAVNENVSFYINVPNSSPYLGPIDSSRNICESSYFHYKFNVTDVDEDELTVDINPKNPFYVAFSTQVNLTFTRYEIFSGKLSKGSVGGVGGSFQLYEEVISVTDGEYIDTANMNITIIEINNAPVITNIGVQTIYTRGDDSTFYKEVQVTDVEDGDQNSENLTFSITIVNSSGDEVNLFSISSNGIIDFTADNSTEVGVYNVSVCVNDTAIPDPHPSIFAICGQDGSSMTTCNNFSLTVTDENRAPTITDYYPSNLSLNGGGTDNFYFNITEYDPDGTLPDVYWYINNIFIEYDSGSLVDEFTYSFGCDVSGNYVVKSEITDGLLNDSIKWDVVVSRVLCPVGGAGGGGGGGPRGCSPRWVCNNWRGVCQHAQKSLELGVLSGEDYRIIREKCAEDNIDEEICGFRIRTCYDMNNCSKDINKPAEVEFCYYTEEPNCYDEIKNCHHGSCELLVDCGGPCLPCPTCSDKLRNQGEEGIDCGGPCPWKCPVKKPFLKRTGVLYMFIFILFWLILLLILLIIRILRMKKKMRGKEGC